ncbi:MAG: hypothetical protein JW713_09320 [Pontiellaceae bacterium]|nr:hypothetical protein [Pontiellaceae bacterium]
MKRVSCLLVVLGTALAASTTYGTMIATEYFNDYGTTATNLNPAGGTALSGGSGWDGGWVGHSDPLRDEKAEYVPGAGLSWNQPGYYNDQNQTGANDGAAVAYPAGTGLTTPYRNITTSETTIWASALISIDDTADRAVLWLDYTSTGANDFVGVLDGNIYMRYNNVNTTSAGAPTTGTHLILTKSVINTSGNDSLSFWFDPDLSGGESGLGAATYEASNADTFGNSFSGIGVLLANASGGSGSNETMDSILIGTTFTDVIPEPAVGTLLIGGAGLLLIVRRRFML